MNNKLKVIRTRVPIALSVIALSLISVTHASSIDSAVSDAAGEAYNGNTKYAIAPIVFRNGQTHMRMLSDINGVAIAEGDMVFGDSEQYFSNAKNRKVKGLSNYVYGTVWPNGVVPYRISGKLSSAAEEKVRAAIAAWNGTGAITMIERSASTESAYPHFIDFVDAEQCASWVGFQNDGAQSIYTGDKCSEGSMIHEIGHAIGLLHEHTRPDRDSFVQINWNNINSDKAHNFDILDDAIPLGDYDYDSIMHYGSHFFSNNGSATISPLNNTGAAIGQREYISDGDRSSVIELYQSEYSLVSSASNSAVAGGAIELDMFITNNSNMGANKLRTETAVPEGSKLVSFSSPSWVCQQGGEGENVVCQSPVLTEGASSSVSVSLSAPTTPGVVNFDTTLSANTFDTNTSNNSDQTSTTIVGSPDALLADENTPALQDLPEIAAATPAPEFAAATPAAEAASTASSGGGSFGMLGGVFGLVLLGYRRRSR